MKILAGDSENEFDADELAEMGDHSKNELVPTAAVCFISIICYE